MDGNDQLIIAWAILGISLMGLEIVAPGFFLMPLGIGGLAAAGVAAADGGLAWQLLGFAIVAAAAFGALRPFARRMNEQDSGLRTGSERLIGAQATVLETVTSHSGMVRVDREDWNAEAADGTTFPAAATVTVLEIRGTRLIVGAPTPDNAAPGTPTP